MGGRSFINNERKLEELKGKRVWMLIGGFYIRTEKRKTKEENEKEK